MIIRGATYSGTFELPFDISLVKDLRITLKQNGYRLTKKLSDVTAEGNSLTMKLTQEETLKFKAKEIIKWEIKTLFIDGTAEPSEIGEIECGDTLCTEVLR